jgi:DNA replication protein DnaC
MDEKSVCVIRNLASRNGELAGDAMPKNTAVKLVKAASVCLLCGGTGWRDADVGQGRRVTRCECFLQTRADDLLKSAGIPERFKNCGFPEYETVGGSSLAAAKIVVEKWAAEYPLDRTGLLLIGPSGLGKTHLAVAAIRELTKKGVRCLFCDYRELLKQIQNSYNSSSQTTELDLLRPVFETEVVVLDDLGAQKPSEWVWDTVSFILNSRYNGKQTTIITANFLDGPSAREEGAEGAHRAARVETLGDRIGERMRSRLFEMCRFVPMDGKDFRKKFRSASIR